MSVLAVIPCLNEAAHLDALLQQILEDPIYTTIVVADGGSCDRSVVIVEEHMQRDARLTWIENPARIQSAGINRAVALHGADHEWLVRIDAHCLYPDLYGSKLVEIAAKRQADAVVVPMVTRGQEGWQAAIATAQNSALGTGGSPHRHLKKGRWVDHGHHALMRMASFCKLGGYCEAMPCNEDAEFDVRQHDDGLRIWLDPRPALTYIPRRTLTALARQYWKYGTGRARTVKRHRIAMKPRQMAPVAVFLALLALPLALLHPIFALPSAVWALVCLIGGAWIGVRSGPKPLSLLAGVPAMVMHAAWGGGFAREWLRGSSADEPRYGLAQ
ncbi:MAG: glycosyltransferase family 2 protein [Pseudomonadota bacterium]